MNNYVIGDFGQFEFETCTRIKGQIIKTPFSTYGTITDIDKKYLSIVDSADPDITYMPERRLIKKFARMDKAEYYKVGQN